VTPGKDGNPFFVVIGSLLALLGVGAFLVPTKKKIVNK
jgi:LPXTG-motif cell wall-anchored protein